MADRNNITVKNSPFKLNGSRMPAQYANYVKKLQTTF